MGEAHSQTLDHIQNINARHNVVEIWECEYEHLRKTDDAFCSFVDLLPIADKLDP